jgi:hypothetical protein
MPTVRARGGHDGCPDPPCASVHTYTYLSVVEAVREEGKNTHRTLLRLGEVSELVDSGQLDRIVKALASYSRKTWLDGDELAGESAASFGAVAAVHAYFRRLGLDEHFAAFGGGRRSTALSDTVFTMLANRLLDPSSKRRTITEWLAKVVLPAGVSAPSLDQCYRAVNALDPCTRTCHSARSGHVDGGWEIERTGCRAGWVHGGLYPTHSGLP